MSKIRQNYKDHVIEVSSLPLRDGGYTMHFFLELHGHEIRVTQFESGQRFETDEEALRAGIELGKQKIEAGYEPKTPVVENNPAIHAAQ